MPSVRPGGNPHQARPGTSPVHYVRDLSGGVNLSTSRESIKDNEAWWMEGLMPQAPGNLSIIPNVTPLNTSITGETGAPSYQMSFNIGINVYVLAVWRNSGNAWVGIPANAFTKIASGKFSSGVTAAACWDGQGIVIINSVSGYYDYNVTSAGVLTQWSNTLATVTISDPGAGYTTVPTPTVTGGGGSGGVVGLTMGLATVAITAAGSGYAVGDVLSIPWTFGTSGSFRVATINGTGGITGIDTITQIGASGSALANPVSGVGGNGTGATFTCTYNVATCQITSRGSGYTSTATVSLTGGGPPTRQASITIAPSGTLLGADIEVYAGRVWIMSGRTITFTDAGSYNSFTGSGSSFTIEDSYLTGDLAAIYGANNYLYIFGPTSIDILSNVTVTSAGTANFSRVNIDPSVGTNQPNSIFGYRRSVMFANASGFWRVSGASAECISDGRLDLLIPKIAWSAIYGATFTVNNLLCAGFLIQFTDSFTQASVTSWMIVIYYNGRWFFSRQSADGATYLALATMSFWNSNGLPAIVGFATDPTKLYWMIEPGNTTNALWQLRTKLYDMGSPMASKQALRVALGFTMPITTFSAVFSIDTDEGNGPAITLSPVAGVGVAGYNMYLGNATTPDDAKYLGFGVVNGAGTPPTRLEWMALEYKETNEWQ